MDAGLLALACSGSFHDLESFLDGTPGAYTIGSSARQPPSLYAVTVGGDTLLHVVAAASHGDSEEAANKASLVYDKAPSLLFVQNNDGDTPLHCAARAGNIQMVSRFILLANDQGVNNAKGLLETQNMIHETALHEAVRGENNVMVNLLMEENSQLARFPEQGTSPLYLAILLKNKVIAQALYELSGGVISYSGPNGRNALHVAVQRSQDLTKMLLEWNSDLLLQRDKNGSTPLHFAIVATRWQICSQVLTSIPDAMYQQDHNGSFPIHVAASIAAIWVIDDFLMKSPSCAGLLDARGRTFLHVAVDDKKKGTVDYVCRNIELSWILNMQDKDGNTALHLAVRKGSLRMFCSLFGNRHVQLNLMNEEGQTPRDIAHYNPPKGMNFEGENKAEIFNVLKYVGAERGIFHQGFLKEHDIDRARQDKIYIMKQVKEGTQTLCIGSVLIATVTFGAMFTMPGGYRADDHINAGSPTLAGTFVFNAFIVANTLAFILSAMGTISLMLSGDPTQPLLRRAKNFRRARYAILCSLAGLVAAFAFGTYMMLVAVAPVTAALLVLYYALLVVAGRFFPLHAPLFTSLCKRKGIWYGIVWAKLFAASLFGLLIMFVPCTYFLSRMYHTGNKVEAPAQPPTPFA